MAQLPLRVTLLIGVSAALAVSASLPTADLSVTIKANPNPVGSGQILTYVLNVVNRGLNASNDVEVSQVLPSGTSLQTAVPSQGQCRAITGTPVTVTCALGTLANQGRASATVTVQARTTRTLTTIAHVQSPSTVDSVPFNSYTSVATLTGVLPDDPIVVAAGDIACDPKDSVDHAGVGSTNWCHQKFTGDLLAGLHPTAILTLGDNEYLDGNLPAFKSSFARTWGLEKALIHPSPGDHEYVTPDASGYFAYFGAAAGRADQGYYSFDEGAWHLIALNTQCGAIGGCGNGSPEERWLRADLAAHPNQCTLAYFHFARFSSSTLGNSGPGDVFWKDLYAAGADVILSGHAHDYERFANQSPGGTLDVARGIREFVVGTGGRNHTPFGTLAPNSEVRNAETFGVLKLVLHPISYDWEFVPEGGATFSDVGSADCH